MTGDRMLDTAILEAFRLRPPHEALTLADLSRLICGSEAETQARVEALKAAGLVAGPIAATVDGGRTWHEHGYALSIRGRLALDDGVI
jgi:hypothetical protein